MLFRNTKMQYGLITILLHWVIALIMIGLVIIGFYMVYLPISFRKLQLFGWHKEWGFLILLLALIRLPWRLINITPLLPDTLPAWQKLSAHAVHWAFYGFMFALPISGWLLTSASALPMSFFRLFIVPNLIQPDDAARQFWIEVHKWLAYGLIAVFIAHVGAALKHFFINKDNILRRILWVSKE